MKKMGKWFGEHDDRGLTLVELMITIGILSIVVIIAGSFMLTSGNSFAKGNADATVQDEAQLAVNQIEDLIIDGVGVETSEDTAKKELVLYHTEETETGTSFIKEVVVWKKDGSNNMYYSKWKVVEDPATGNFVEEGAALYPEQLLAEHVTAFEVDLETVAEKAADGTDVTVVKSVQIAVGCESGVGVGNAAYATTPLITLRNRMIQGDPKSVFHDVPVSDDTLVLFIADEGAGEGTAVPIIDRVTTVDRSKGYDIFAMRESVTNVNALVNWQIEEGDSASTIDANGTLRVGQFEPNSYLTIVARYKSSPNKMAKGVVKVAGGSAKSLDAVKILTDSLAPFAPKYSSKVTTTGFEPEEIEALTYKWTVSEPNRVENFTDSGKELSLNIKKEKENYGKYFTITLVVHSDLTGQTVSDSILYRIDPEGTMGGDSNMERGKLDEGESSGSEAYHGENWYSLKPQYSWWPLYVDMDYYFCDEYGNYISADDVYKDCVVIRFQEWESYYLTFNRNLPPEREYYIKVRLNYHDATYSKSWTYERIHYICAASLIGETTRVNKPNVWGGGHFDFYYKLIGYYDLDWRDTEPVEYEITLDYEAPEGVTLEPKMYYTETAGNKRLHAQAGFDVKNGTGKEFYEIADHIKVKSATIKISMKDHPDIYTYDVIYFNE